MKKILAALLLCTTAAGAVTAGTDVVPVTGTPTIDAPEMQNDWSGFYLGGLYSAGSGALDSYINDQYAFTFSANGSSIGGFAGYNIQRNALVFGAELAYQEGESTFISPTQFVGTDRGTNIDAKGRLGFALDNVLLYGVVGGSWTSFFDGGVTYNWNGFNYGAGAEMKFGNGMFIGAEYLMRNVSGRDPLTPMFSNEYSTQSIELRVGKRF